MVEELADGAVVVELPYAGTSWLVREILRGAGDLVVLEPEDAREAIAKERRCESGDRRSPAAPGHPEILRIVAPNPGPMTLEGTNTYLYGSGPCAVIDPGPDDARPPRRRSAPPPSERGGIGVVLLTHGHGDHADGAGRLRRREVGPRPATARSTPACARSRPRATPPTTSA